MVRTYKLKTNRTTSTAPHVLEQAAAFYLNNTSYGTRTTCQQFGVSRGKLHRYLAKLKDSENASCDVRASGYSKHLQVFTPQQEETLVAYIKHAADVYFGLSHIDVRTLAFECAKRFGINMPSSWAENERAGADWFSGCLKRHTTLSIRTPESTSIARATSFNKSNVDQFFQQLQTVMDRHTYEAKDIWNVDETGITTAQKPQKVVAQTGMKQVGSLTSADRGELVTLCAAVSAGGQAIPPFFIFPHVRFRSHFMTGATTGSVGVAHKSGWLMDENFVEFLRHFVHNVKPSKESPVLLTLDNHNSHLSIAALDYAKENGIACYRSHLTVLINFSP